VCVTSYQDFTLFTASQGGKTHDLMISLGRGLGHSEGLTYSLFCLQEITVTCRPIPHVTEH
jgi:hypothetical protein